MAASSSESRIIFDPLAGAPPLDDLVADALESGRRGGPTPWGWHRWEDLLKCPRKYDLLYNQHCTVPARSNALEFGGLLHECLALYYEEANAILSEQDDARADQLYDAYCHEPQWHRLLAEIENSGVEAYFEVVEDVLRVMRAYLEHYPMLRDKFLEHEIVAVEEFMDPPGPFNFTARMDLAYRAPRGLWVVDHKSSKAMTEDLASGWALNGQMLGLMYAAPRHWPDEQVLGLVVNILVRTKVPQFKRVTVPLYPAMVDVWVERLTMWVNHVLPFYADVGWPPNFASCIHRYGRCPFYDYCETGDEAFLEDGGG